MAISVQSIEIEFGLTGTGTELGKRKREEKDLNEWRKKVKEKYKKENEKKELLETQKNYWGNIGQC